MTWRTSLVFERERAAKLSTNCVHFLQRLICDPGDRLGKNGVSEIKSHPWFAGVDFDNIRSQEAPFPPKFSRPVEQIFAELKTRPHTDPVFQQLLDELCANFDSFDDEPLPGNRNEAGAGAGAGGVNRRTPGGWSDQKFIGYTFRRT